MKVKRLLCLGMAATLLCSNLPQITVHAQESDDLQQEKEYASETDEIISGKCGDNVYYEFDPSTGMMRIYGEGAMYDFNRFDGHPWYREEYAADIKKVRIEEGVTGVGTDAFACFKNRYGEYDKYGCKNLTSVEIADTVTNIGARAFYCCPIKSIRFPDSLETIGNGAFAKSSLTEINWGNSLKSIDIGAFASIEIEELVLPQNLESIGNECFAYCKHLKKVIIPNNYKMRGYVFSYCQALKDVEIGSNCKIGGYAFQGCDKLENVEIGFNCEVGGYAFNKCTSLSDRKSGAVYKVVSAKTKGGAVEYIKPLNRKAAKVSIPSAAKTNGVSYKVTGIAANALKNNRNITKAKIGNNVVSIGKNSFSGCSKLKTLTIGSNVALIGDNAFLNCTSLKAVTIPAKVKKIGKQAFYGCKRLKTIKIGAKKLSDKNVGSKAFAKADPKAVVKVPASCLKSYKKLLQKRGLNGKKQRFQKI